MMTAFVGLWLIASILAIGLIYVVSQLKRIGDYIRDKK